MERSYFLECLLSHSVECSSSLVFSVEIWLLNETTTEGSILGLPCGTHDTDYFCHLFEGVSQSIVCVTVLDYFLHWTHKFNATRALLPLVQNYDDKSWEIISRIICPKRIGCSIIRQQLVGEGYCTSFVYLIAAFDFGYLCMLYLGC